MHGPPYQSLRARLLLASTADRSSFSVHRLGQNGTAGITRVPVLDNSLLGNDA